MFTSLLKLLGSLPASTSEGGTVNSLDYKKILRMGIVLLGSYVIVAVLEKLSVDVAGWSFIPSELITPVTGLLALFLEWARRKLSSAKVL